MLNRRNFMKMCGAIVASPLALVKAKQATTFASHPADILLDLGMPDGEAVKMARKICDEPAIGGIYEGGLVSYDWSIHNSQGEPILPIKHYERMLITTIDSNQAIQTIYIRGGGIK